MGYFPRRTCVARTFDVYSYINIPFETAWQAGMAGRVRNVQGRT